MAFFKTSAGSLIALLFLFASFGASADEPVVKILNSVTQTITPSGGQIDLDGIATVSFPAGAFETTQDVTVSQTTSNNGDLRGLAKDQFILGDLSDYEIQIKTGKNQISKSIHISLKIPQKLIARRFGKDDYIALAQYFYDGGNEQLDSFDPIRVTYDEELQRLDFDLKPQYFTSLRNAYQTFEAILISGVSAE